MAIPSTSGGRPSGCPHFQIASPRLRVVDEGARRDHSCLEAGDVCFYHGEYLAGAGIKTPTNDLILDLKKDPARHGKIDWRYKLWAIEDCARVLRLGLDLSRLEGVTLVPVPPSKRSDHPAYDDRMVQVVKALCAGTRLDCREILVTTRNRAAGHGANGRSRIETLRASMTIDAARAVPAPECVILFDDVLTSGATFKACQAVLWAAFPSVEVAGCFVARRVLAAG
jgi:hypothetical protein